MPRATPPPVSPHPASPPPGARRALAATLRRRWPWLLALALIAFGLSRLPVGPAFLALVTDLRAAGATGVLTFAAVYVLATLCFLPVWLLTAGAGFAWGFGPGLLVVSPVGLLSAAVLFGLARALGRQRLQPRLARGGRLAALDGLFAAQGPRLILWLRLSPVFPFGLVNAAAGLSRLPFLSFLWSTALGMLPGLAVYLYFGAMADEVHRLLGGGRAALETLHPALMVGGLVVMLAVTAQVSRLAARALRTATSKS